MKKIITFLLLTALLLSAVSCITPNTDDDVDESVYYDDIIEKYSKLLHAKSTGETVATPGDTADEIDVALCEIVKDCADPSIMGYATKDINGDGIDELVLLDKKNKLYALFTVKNDAPVLLLKLDSMIAAITPDGTVYADRYIKGEGDCTIIKKIVDGELIGLEFGLVTQGDSHSFYKVEDGNRVEITFEERETLSRSIEQIMSQTWYYTNTTGFRFVPAIANDSEQNTAPVPDFSTYDGILSAYKTIVGSFSGHLETKWAAGEFDNLFNISDNDTYEIFHQIVWGAIRVKPTETYYGQEYAKDGCNAYGYAKKDLNKDGAEELILLNDNYEIFAIFTMKDGKAVLIDGTYGVWVDENGRIRKSVITGGITGRDEEVFVYEINGTKLDTVIGVGYKVNIYFEKEGWYKTDGNTKTDISDREGEALYAVYDILPTSYRNLEYTRDFSGIEFVALFEATLATEKHINTFYNPMLSKRELTVSAVSDNEVTVNIKILHADLNGKAIRDGNRYGFEIDGVKGYIEFAVNSAWVIVTESENGQITPKAYLLDYLKN